MVYIMKKNIYKLMLFVEYFRSRLSLESAIIKKSLNVLHVYKNCKMLKVNVKVKEINSCFKLKSSHYGAKQTLRMITS